jgi:hypothetical protein
MLINGISQTVTSNSDINPPSYDPSYTNAMRWYTLVSSYLSKLQAEETKRAIVPFCAS